MFEDLARFSRIFVTGPQRSGTTICAKMIARDTGHRYVDECHYGLGDRIRFAGLQGRSKIVVQCPIHCYHIEDCSCPDNLIVLMRRPIEEIIASQERIRWQKNEPVELANYGKGPEEGPIAQVKYLYWEEHQRPLIENWLEIHYHSLSSHPLWVPAEERRNFHCRQTRRNQP